MTADAPWTIGRLLQWTTEYFRKQETASPRLDAEVLLATARSCERIELYTAYDEVAEEELRMRFRELVRRRAAGEPVAYLVGRREFYSMPFIVTPDVLIPRPETELVVVSLLDAAKQREMTGRPWQVADVGTGSGIIAIAVAKHLANCQVTAIDIRPPTLEVARSNAAAIGLNGNVRFLESDLLSELPAQPQFDFIASNPPYVSDSEYGELAAEVKDYEPIEALVAGPTGVEVIERLIPQAAERLFEQGRFFFEISPMIEQRVRELLAGERRFQDIQVVKDQSGHARVVSATKA
jgi:release factor glutamine methyltransferase